MKLTCLSKGQGYYFPPCHVLEIGGFRILIDCPIDLSALSVFSPVPVYSDSRFEEAFDCSCNVSMDDDSVAHKKRKVDNSLDASKLIHAVPWYKTVSTLHLWDVSMVDVVLISSPMGMLGLPFLTRNKSFSAKIFATQATARIGQLMMEDLISMHVEFRQFYGPEESESAHWMKWEQLDKLPPSLQELILGKNGTELGGWLPLYSAEDAKYCFQKVQSVKYAEESCYAGLLIIKALSSGLDIGTSNWVIKSPKKDVTFLSSSVFVSAAASTFDCHALRGCDIALYSDFSPLADVENIEEEADLSVSSNENASAESLESLINCDESSEEEQKLEYICSYAVDSLKAGGSVLVSIGRLGVILQLLEQLSFLQDISTLKVEVPIFFISSVAEELLSYTNIIPEWLCMKRQKKLFAGESLFAHVDLVKEKRLHLLPSIFAPNLLKIWQEPCIVFAPHWSLRFGPAVHLLQRWRGDENSLLVLEKGPDADLTLLPFKPMTIKVLQCSFLSGIGSAKVAPLLKNLLPKHVLFPEDLRNFVGIQNSKSYTVDYYTENNMLHVSSLKKNAELEISAELTSHFRWITLGEDDLNITRLQGDLYVEHGKYKLLMGNELKETCIDLETLSTVLQNMGMKTTVEQPNRGGLSRTSVLRVHEPGEAMVEAQPMRTLIRTCDKDLASRLFEAVDTVLSSS